MTEALRQSVGELAAERATLIDSVFDSAHGPSWCEAHTRLADRLVLATLEETLRRRPGAPSIAIVATGGYGRRELAPHSDVDLTVVPAEVDAPALDELLRELFQTMHEAFRALGMEVGYALRLVGDAPGLDGKTRTGLLDARLVAGDGKLFQELREALEASFAAGEFLSEKIRERDQQMRRWHETPYVVEPHLKEGAGGLRCFQAANWVREAVGERPVRGGAAYARVIWARNLLHASADRRLDTLTRARQAEIADRLGQDVYAFQASIAEAMAELHRGYEDVLSRLPEVRFNLAPGVEAIRGESRLIGLPDAGTAAAGLAIAGDLGLRVDETGPPGNGPINGAAALWALATGERTLRNLDRCGVLDVLLPELTACRTLMPRDGTHAYTVFEHTLRLLRNLDELPAGSFLGEIRASLVDPEPLVLAILLHDVGKIDAQRSHSEVGAEIAVRVGRRWGLDEAVVQEVAWLVREHLTMARFLRMRDLADPRTAQEFAMVVGQRERMERLALLTYADVAAVAPGAWTMAQEAFLRELFERTLLVLEGDAVADPDPDRTRRRLMQELRSTPVEETRVQAFVQSLPAHYLTTTPPDVVRQHLLMAQKAKDGVPSLDFSTKNELAATEITVCAKDRQGLLSEILGVLYAFDLSVMGIRAGTTSTQPPIAVDTFTVSFANRPVPPATRAQVEQAMLAVLRGAPAADLLRAKGKDPDREQVVLGWQLVEGAPGILEVRAPRGRGMPYRVARLVANQGWNIVSARVGQWAGNAAAAIYANGPGGGPLRNEHVEAALGAESRLG